MTDGTLETGIRQQHDDCIAAGETTTSLVGGALETRWTGRPGLLASICHYALVPTGKLFRPSLLLEAALAVGGSATAVLPAAVGAECGHVASLIHDDIIDGDDLRRGRPSVQCAYGIADAIIAGDALIFDLFAGLAECHHSGVPAARVVAALEAVAQAGLDLCRGQSMEAELHRDRSLDLDAYLLMISLKTAALFRGACKSGALLGGGPPNLVDALCDFGESLGLAFQMYDDLLPYVSDTEVMGKPQASDVKNGRPTLPIILACSTATPADRQLISDALFGPGDAGPVLAVVREILDRTGAICAATEMARQYAKQSRAALDQLPPSPSRDRLSILTDLAVGRSY
ncbi:MAG TPA: polyprenyl synthetase family protein [Streptosporangiaceae bacterium]|jgi:geranylgeranyl pyrophosphate synthase|nr:polyprenyl synthetase family protein [Streptosporangiaceae bacterium]